MKIDARADYCGVELLRIRDLLRSSTGSLNTSYIQKRLVVEASKAREILTALIDDGLVEEAQWPGYYTLTLDGAQLANATAARKVKRATAEAAVRGLLARVETVNTSCEYLYRVRDIKVFGSFLGTEPYVSDVDLCVNLEPKYDQEEMVILAREQIAAERRNGRRFRNLVHELGWPQYKVLGYLKSRSPVLSIELGDDPILERAYWEYLYQWSNGSHT